MMSSCHERVRQGPGEERGANRILQILFYLTGRPGRVPPIAWGPCPVGFCGPPRREI